METLSLSPEAYKRVYLALLVVVATILVVAYFPLTLWFAFLWSAFRASVYLGHWPGYDQPDPQRLPPDFGPIPAWTETAVPILFWGMLIALTMLMMKRFVRKRLWLWTATLLWFVAWAAGIALMAMDPGSAMEWMAD